MKYLLEFDSEAEMFAWARMKADSLDAAGDALGIRPDPERPVEASTRRQGFSEGEMAFVAEHYPTKTVRWIARQLFRKESQIRALVLKMRRAGGLPRKYARRNGEIAEEAA